MVTARIDSGVSNAFGSEYGTREDVNLHYSLGFIGRKIGNNLRSLLEIVNEFLMLSLTPCQKLMCFFGSHFMPRYWHFFWWLFWERVLTNRHGSLQRIQTHNIIVACPSTFQTKHFEICMFILCLCYVTLLNQNACEKSAKESRTHTHTDCVAECISLAWINLPIGELEHIRKIYRPTNMQIKSFSSAFLL